MSELSDMHLCSRVTGVLCKQPMVVMWRTPVMLTFLYGKFFQRLMVAQPVLDGMLTDMSHNSLFKKLQWSETLNCENWFYYSKNLLIRMDLSADPSPYGKAFCFKGFRNLLSFSKTVDWFCFWILLFLYCFQFPSLSPSYVIPNTSVFAFRSTIYGFCKECLCCFA